MKQTLRMVCVLAGVIVLLAGAVGPARAQSSSGEFLIDDCQFDIPVGLEEGEDLLCGYLEVPERYEYPYWPTIYLAVAIIRNKAGTPDRDPVFFAQGGPGGSTLDTFPMILVDHPLREKHDLVLFDQRGTLYSWPNLACPEFMEEGMKVLDEDISAEEALRIYQRAATDCHDRLAYEEGIDLSAYNSLNNARDVDSLRRALGYQQINFYGVSYGTLLAQHVMRAYPETLRSVILDAVVPTDVDFLFTATRTFDEAFTRLFEACEADEACARDYPDLERVFFEQVERLDETPEEIILADLTGERSPTGSRGYPALIDGDGLIDTLGQAIYASELLPLLPKMIYDVKDGKWGMVERILSLITFDDTMMEGMYYSVMCSEDGIYDPASVDWEGIRPRILLGEEESNIAVAEVCEKWDVEQVGDMADRPVVSSVPTLVLNGRFDPITPPSYGEKVAQTLERSYVYTFPNTAHGALGNECADQLMADFVDYPFDEPDAACLAEQSLDIVTERDLVEFPALLRALNLEPLPLALLVGILLLGLFLLSAWLYFPISWLVRQLRGEERGPLPATAAAAPWVALAAGPAALVFVIGVIGAGVKMALDNEMLIILGLAARYRWLFALPLAFAALTLVIVVLAIVNWKAAGWSVWRKVYYSLLALAAVGCVALLAMVGAIGAY